jgi:homoaconitase/3-isopropylmalate dehydratase large subunit
MEERMTLCKMVTQAGGKNGTMPADATTYKYLEVHNYDLNAYSTTLALLYLLKKIAQ